MNLKPVQPLPLHFKLPGRSYSQIGRKGNVALYQVFSDYLIVPGFALPYLTIGFELVCIKTVQNRERYPYPWQFGHCAWSIPTACLGFAHLALECAASDGINFKSSQLQPFLTGKVLPRNARLWRRFKDNHAGRPIKMPNSRQKGGLPSAKR